MWQRGQRSAPAAKTSPHGAPRRQPTDAIHKADRSRAASQERERTSSVSLGSDRPMPRNSTGACRGVAQGPDCEGRQSNSALHGSAAEEDTVWLPGTRRLSRGDVTAAGASCMRAHTAKCPLRMQSHPTHLDRLGKHSGGVKHAAGHHRRVLGRALGGLIPEVVNNRGVLVVGGCGGRVAFGWWVQVRHEKEFAQGIYAPAVPARCNRCHGAVKTVRSSELHRTGFHTLACSNRPSSCTRLSTH